MHSKRYVPSFKLLQFGPAFEYHQISEANKGHKRLRNVLHYLLHIDQVIIDDPYAVEELDYLILGDDPVLAACTALHLARNNKSVLIHQSQREESKTDYLAVFNARTEMFNVFFQTRLDLEAEDYAHEPETLVKEIGMAIGNIAVDGQRPLVMISDSSVRLQSYGTGKGPWETLWAEYTPPTARSAMWESMMLSLPRFSFHAEGATKRHKSNPKCRIRVRNVILTSRYNSDLTSNFKCPVVKMGEALRPISTFEQFTIHDRILDVLETEHFKTV